MRAFVLILLCAMMAASLPAQRKKKPNKKDIEPPTQILEALPEPPDAISAETARLSFQLSPLSAKGLLSQQVRDALKALAHDNHGAQIVKLRAFVAGSGDLRRVSAIVSEEFTDQKKMLPVITTVQVGGLPMVGSQVLIEATSVDRRVTNPNGLAFLSGVVAKDPAAAVAELKQSADAARVEAPNMLRVTCFLSTLDHGDSTRSAVAAAFPSAATTVVQTQRQSIEPYSVCEGIGRLTEPPASAVSVSQRGALMNSAKIVFTSAQLVFKDEDSDVRLAFQRLNKDLEPMMVSGKDVTWQGVYSLTRPRAAQIATIKTEFIDAAHPPAGTSLLFEGLPSNDATAAIEWIAAGK